MDIDNRLRFYCERSIYDMGYKVHIAAGHPVTAVAKAIEFTPHDPGTISPEQPALTLTDDAAQELIDTLWAAGLRPAGGKQSEGVTAAQSKHLEDMRALAFAKLNVGLPA